MGEFIGEFLGFIIVVVVVIVIICKVRNAAKCTHPRKCSICGNTDTSTITLKDGCICYKCAAVRYMGRRINLGMIIDDSRFRSTTVREMKDYINTLQSRGELMRSFRPTRVSEDGLIEMDDNLGLFVIKDPNGNAFAHRPQDVISFRLVIDKNYINSSEDILIDGGHIAIRLREPIGEIDIGYGSRRDSIGARHETKKALEPDFRFLEEITGKRRG